MMERGIFAGIESLQLSLDMPKLCAMPLLKSFITYRTRLFLIGGF
ncbi:hypothetical protein C5S35_04340 [Candidatus Methanophagaceae archaeon]|nr:hypothetical protein C5S35_04340 [Methanophagales archaeon]